MDDFRRQEVSRQGDLGHIGLERMLEHTNKYDQRRTKKEAGHSSGVGKLNG